MLVAMPTSLRASSALVFNKTLNRRWMMANSGMSGKTARVMVRFNLAIIARLSTKNRTALRFLPFHS
jgi:hypothetical protein